MRFTKQFEDLLMKHSDGESSFIRGYPSEVIDQTEERLGVPLPRALREFYVSVGKMQQLFEIHNKVRLPEDIALEDGHIIFMDENQHVVSWGFIPKANDDDPEVWQRVNEEEEWYSEEMTLLQLLESMLAWYQEKGILRGREGDS